MRLATILYSAFVLSTLTIAGRPDAARGDDDEPTTGDDTAPPEAEAPAPPAAPAKPATNPNLGAMKRADDYRKSALRTAISALRALDEQLEKGVDPEFLDDGKTTDVADWLLTPRPTDRAQYTAYRKILARAIAVIQKQVDRGEVAMYVFPDPTAVAMCDRYGAKAFAWHDGKIALCEPWTTKGAECQRVVVIHEHFHAAGLAEVTNPPDVDQALKSPDYMAGLVSKLNSGNSDRCDR